MVDESRITFSISGTHVRSNPIAYWEYLEPPVRGFYAKRVCLVGAESTGKTTLAAKLAEHYQTVWVPEYGREYSELKLAKDGHYAWHTEEFTHIAKTQIEREDQAACSANKVLICDTDAFATSIWHRRYLGQHSAEVETLASRHRCPDLYLLTDVDVPFTQDGTRDGESIRAWMHETFISELTKQKRPFRQIAGTPEEQFNKSVIFIDEVVGNSTAKEISCS
jgi:NadR type nicotinamide-nucleotide adenylyltransferase